VPAGIGQWSEPRSILHLPPEAASTDFVLSEHALREECSAFSQAGIRDCLAKKADVSQKILRQAENYMVSALSKWDEDGEYISLAKAKIAASSKDFVRYRNAQCEFSASLSGGGAGNAYEIGRLACVAELNGRRAEQLRNAAANLTMK
jgi:Lysozyme inhibitor LprI